jgi:hypothetical protein
MPFEDLKTKQAQVRGAAPFIKQTWRPHHNPSLI